MQETNPIFAISQLDWHLPLSLKTDISCFLMEYLQREFILGKWVTRTVSEHIIYQKQPIHKRQLFECDSDFSKDCHI